MRSGAQRSAQTPNPRAACQGPNHHRNTANTSRVANPSAASTQSPSVRMLRPYLSADPHSQHPHSIPVAHGDLHGSTRANERNKVATRDVSKRALQRTRIDPPHADGHARLDGIARNV